MEDSRAEAQKQVVDPARPATRTTATVAAEHHVVARPAIRQRVEAADQVSNLYWSPSGSTLIAGSGSDPPSSLVSAMNAGRRFYSDTPRIPSAIFDDQQPEFALSSA